VSTAATNPRASAPVVREPWIDVMRGAAALAVTLFHFNCVLAPDSASILSRAWHALWSHGHLGVPVFFAISGYCIFQGWNRAPGPLPFLTRRLRRIFPPYLASLGVVLLVVALTWFFTGVNDVVPLPRSPVAVLASLTLLTSPVSSVPVLNWVYWTLSAELFFYLVAGALLLAAPSRRLPFLAVLHAVLCLGSAAGFGVSPGPLFFVSLWPAFGLGAALAARRMHPRLGGVMLLTSAAHLGFVLAAGGDRAFVGGAALATAAIAGLRLRPRPGLFAGMAACGVFSYSLYLVHVPLGVFGAQRLLLALAPAGPLATILAQFAALALVLGAAHGFYLLVERPFLPSLAGPGRPAKTPVSALASPRPSPIP
jgi:peptidoglycan/LPS O-acetylase OafA/YrhL